VAGGWARDGAVQDQIDASVSDGVARARGALASGESLADCAECGESIPAARRRAVPGVRLCIDCQQALDARNGAGAGINRRGSKDSQLR
jgi:phage/conjugal plasmid C-4 type zinc finger TraR family protein